MNEQLRQNRDRAVQRFLEGGRTGTLYVTLCADDLLDGDLYWEASPLAFLAKQCVLVLDDTVATIDGGVLIVCLRELRSLGFSFAVPDDMDAFRSAQSDWQRPVAPGAGDSANSTHSPSLQLS